MRLMYACAALCLFSTLATGQSATERFNALLDEEWEYTMRTFPEFATSVGYAGQNDRWTDRSAEAIEARKAHERELLVRIGMIPREALDEAAQLNYDLLRSQVKLSIEGQRFEGELMELNQMWGVQQSLAMTMVQMPGTTTGQFADIVGRLEDAGARIDQEIALLKRGAEKGLVPPRVTLRDVPEQVSKQIFDDPFASPMLGAFANMPDSIPGEDREGLRAAAAVAYRESVRPAFERLHAFLEDEYLPAAREGIACADLPDGAARYAYNVKTMTTTELTPEEIHQIGLDEVKRIRGEMDRVIEDSGFEGSFGEFTTFLRDDPQFYFERAEDLLAGYREISKRLDPELVRLFGRLPRLPYGVRAVPDYAEKSAATAFYESGTLAGGRAGYFYANTYAIETRPKWEMEALTAHEAVPGHHLQIAIAQELEAVPEFRRFGGYTAYIEGWGLYAESLGEEMGLYEDPYSKFGQLTYEIWRAIRLVVDTGMHQLGWTRQQAIDYFVENTGKAEHDIVVEVDRYIVWPGQALAYKIGELRIKELRARAESELGEDFDIRGFHDMILGQGALPLDILEARADAWIVGEKR